MGFRVQFHAMWCQRQVVEVHVLTMRDLPVGGDLLLLLAIESGSHVRGILSEYLPTDVMRTVPSPNPEVVRTMLCYRLHDSVECLDPCF